MQMAPASGFKLVPHPHSKPLLPSDSRRATRPLPVSSLLAHSRRPVLSFASSLSLCRPTMQRLCLLFSSLSRSDHFRPLAPPVGGQIQWAPRAGQVVGAVRNCRGLSEELGEPRRRLLGRAPDPKGRPTGRLVRRLRSDHLAGGARAAGRGDSRRVVCAKVNISQLDSRRAPERLVAAYVHLENKEEAAAAAAEQTT